MEKFEAKLSRLAACHLARALPRGLSAPTEPYRRWRGKASRRMLPFVEESPADRARILFVTSPLTIGADTWIHLLLLRHLSQSHFELHAAGQPASPGEAEPAQAFEALLEVSGVLQKPTYFGPSLYGQSKAQKLKSVTKLVPAAVSLLSLARYIRQHRIQVLHSSDRPRDALACVVLAALTGAKSVIHVHVKYGDWMSPGVKWALGRADALVGVSQFVAESLVSAGYQRERVHAVLNAIDPAKWDPSLSPAEGRSSLGIPADAPLILSVSRLFPGKGQASLIQALGIVKREVPDVRLVIVGEDYPVGSGTTRCLTALAVEHGVASNVIFTGQRKDVAELLAASDVFALPSYEEPFGLVYAEAMAMKRPVVGLTNGGTPEVVDHGKSGLLSAPDDIQGLATNLLTLLRDPSLRARLGEYGRCQVESRFAPDRMASDFGSLYARLVG
jgi:glycosyltransferase involved in cell wall biosynthesis